MKEPLEIPFTEFDEYIRQGEPNQKEKASIWSLAIGLQQVDQLQVSSYLKQTAAEHIEGKISNLPNGISRTTEFLQLFLRNILLGEQNELRNRYLHILWMGSRPQLSKTNDTQVADKVADKTPDKILHILANNPLITTIQIAQQLNMSDSGVRKVITALKARGILRRVGANKNGHWEIIGKLSNNNNRQPQENLQM